MLGSLPDALGPPPPGHLDAGVVGDVVLAESLWPAASDANAVLREACWGRLAGCSIVLANLEAPLTVVHEPAVRKPYNFRTDRRALDLFDARFVLGLANNHIMDYGARGLAETLDALDGAGLSYAGAGMNLDRARAPHYRQVSGIGTAIICAADPRYNAATPSTPGTCPARLGLVGESVREARRRARFVAVTIHMGMEYSAMPSARQVALAEECVDSGAQLVVFHHTHCVGGHSTRGRGLVLWATGNYVFPTVGGHWSDKARRTASWRVRYSESRDSATVVSITPARTERRGLPQAIDPRAAVGERERMARQSQRIETPWRRHVWQGLEMMQPSFLRYNVTNYARLLRHLGVVFVWRSLVAGIRAQFSRKHQ